MAEENLDPRVDSEWVAVNAFRELLKLSTKGNMQKSTYDEAMEFGGMLYPALLGQETSILRRAKESDTTREYRQRARLKSTLQGREVLPLELLQPDIEELETLLSVAKRNRERGRVDQLRNRLSVLCDARDEIDPPPHTENQLIFRDVSAFPQGLPSIESGQGYRSFELPDGNTLRVHVLHPDKPEKVSGADVLYERHVPGEETATLVLVQYKIWEKQVLSLADPRMQEQLRKLKAVACEGGLCQSASADSPYRFPHCAAFLRPTDKLQRPDQKLISSGEHLPVCKIEQCSRTNRFGTPVIDYKSIRATSLSAGAFEYLFSYDKLGSRQVSYEELDAFYKELRTSADAGRMVIHAQERLARTVSL